MKLREVIISEANGEYVAVSVGGSFNGMLKLNDTAAFIAQELQEETTIEAIAEKMCSNYEVDLDTAIESVKAVIAEFNKVGLIEE